MKSFDCQWALYERSYVFELMVIEKDARRFVLQAIQQEQTLQQLEKGRSGDTTEARRQLVQRLCEINPVTNTQGKGREDFKVEVLLRCEELLAGSKATKAVRKISEQVKHTFQLFRMLLRKYADNIEVVDPMLRNNKELGDIVGDLEKAWALAKDHMLEDEKLTHLMQLSSAIESACGRYKQFAEMVETCDSDIFMTVPCLAVLRGLVNEEESGICRRFLPSVTKEGEVDCRKTQELKAEFLKLRAKVCGNTEFIIRTNSSH